MRLLLPALLLAACSHGGSVGQQCTTLAGGGTLAQSGVLVTLEVRFLAVEDDFARDFGISWNLELLTNPAPADLGGRSGHGADVLVDSLVSGGGDGGLYFLPRGHLPDSFLPLAFEGLQSPFGSGVVFPRLAGLAGECVVFDPSLLMLPGNVALDYSVQNPASVDGDPLAFQATLLDDLDVEALLLAIDADPDHDTVPFPRVTLRDGQAAAAMVENTQALIADFDAAIRDAIRNVDPQVQFVNSGPSLEIRGTIAGGDVRLTIRPTLMATFRPTNGIEVAGQPGTLELPVVIPQALTTTVTVPEGRTLLLGGQKLVSEPAFGEGVPVLGRVPLIGAVFQPWSPIQEGRHLMLLVTPRIVSED